MIKNSAVFLGVLLSTSAFAAESVSQVMLDAGQKQALITSMQNEIALHQGETQPQILTDLAQRFATLENRITADPTVTPAQAQSLQLQVTGIQQALASQSQETIVALETLQLQQIQSSESLPLAPFFVLTQDDVNNMNAPQATTWDKVVGTLWFPFAAILDVVLVPWSIFLALTAGV